MQMLKSIYLVSRIVVVGAGDLVANEVMEINRLRLSVTFQLQVSVPATWWCAHPLKIHGQNSACSTLTICLSWEDFPPLFADLSELSEECN